MERDQIITTVWNAKPALHELVLAHGTSSPLSYIQHYEKNTPRARDAAQDEILLDALSTLLRAHFDIRITREVIEEFKKLFFVSTADHGGAACHPFFSNALLARILSTKKQNRELVMTLPCSGVSLDNSSFPRGLTFHDKELNEIRLHTKSLHERHDSVYNTSPYTKKDTERMLHELEILPIDPSQKNLLSKIIRDVYDREEQYAKKTFDEQMVWINWILPKYILGCEHIEHISISQEMLVREILLLHLDQSSLLTTLLTDEHAHTVYEKHFDGTAGAHSSESGKGTFLFWGLSETGVRIQLVRGKDGWYTKDGVHFLRNTSSEIKEALRLRKIYPCMALTFVVLSCVHRVTCGGGFSQINYLTDISENFQDYCGEMQYSLEPFPPTNIFTGEFIVNVLENDTRKVPATLIDTILYQEPSTQMKLSTAYAETSLENAILAMMPEYYKIITGESVEQTHFPLPPATLHVRNNTNI